MKKFAFGFVTCWCYIKYRPEIIKYIKDLTAKLELKKATFEHDHPGVEY
jgi:hypothetical protein